MHLQKIVTLHIELNNSLVDFGLWFYPFCIVLSLLFSGPENNEETRLKANVNVVSLKVGSLVDISKGSAKAA